MHELEARHLLTTPTFGWTLDTPAAHPVAWMDSTGTGLTTAAGFNAENLNTASGSFNTSKGVDGTGGYTFGPSSGTPADGNYEFTVPGSAFSPAASDVEATDFFVNGDFNHDRVVDFDDYVIYAQNYGGASKSFALGDADGDGDVDSADYAFVTSRYNTRLAAPATYDGEVTVSSLAVQTDGTTPLVVNWAPMSDDDVQASDPSNADKAIAGYTVYRSTDGNTFTQLTDVARVDPPPHQRYEYHYTDPTPMDGAKYWYRIRPYYAVTEPDGSDGFQHLPTTNKAWKVSAIRPPSMIASSRVGDDVFVSWTDNSVSETGFRIEQQNTAGTWVTLATTAANANSYAFDASTLTGTTAGNAIRVTATNTTVTIASAPVSTTPSVIATTYTLDTTVSRRVNVNENTVGYEYDAGTAHANETVTLVDPAGDSGFTAGTYTLDAQGKVTLPLTVTHLPTSVKQVQIRFPSPGEGGIDVGPDPYDYGTNGPGAINMNPASGVGTGVIATTYPQADGLPTKVSQPTAIGPTPGTSTPATPLPKITVSPDYSKARSGNLPIDVVVTFTPPPPPLHGSYDATVIITAADGSTHPITITVTF